MAGEVTKIYTETAYSLMIKTFKDVYLQYINVPSKIVQVKEVDIIRRMPGDRGDFLAAWDPRNKRFCHLGKTDLTNYAIISEEQAKEYLTKSVEELEKIVLVRKDSPIVKEKLPSPKMGPIRRRCISP